MLHVKLNEERAVAVLEPEGVLVRTDFEAAAEMLDPYIEAKGSLAGLVIHVEHFPGWDSFGTLVQHLKFVRSHHHEIQRVAICTDSSLGHFAENVGNHFIAAEIQSFTYRNLNEALAWATEAGK